jgi:predicted CXXCH cytochrome family protein
MQQASLFSGSWVLLLLLTLLSAIPVAAQATLPDGYVGSEVCAGCHEDISKAFAKNKHAVVDVSKSRGWQERACESCHGPGAKHAESVSAADILQPRKLPIRLADKQCFTCHKNQMTQVGRIQGGHGRNQVACVACHTVHRAEGEPEHRPFSAMDTQRLLAAKPALSAGQGTHLRRPHQINQACGTCHGNVLAQFQKPYRHRVAEGIVSCVDCHNPHGGLLPKQIRSANMNEPGCFRCHGDKRGPFVFEHAPVRLENCSSCHEPHGSVNPRMLIRHEERFLCLECHSNIGSRQAIGGIAPAFHDLNNPRFRVCSTCHVKIHGSNVNRDFLR